MKTLDELYNELEKAQDFIEWAEWSATATSE